MNTLTVGELIAMLEEYDEETPVVMLQQPRWAFIYSVAAVTSLRELVDENYEDIMESANRHEDPELVEKRRVVAENELTRSVLVEELMSEITRGEDDRLNYTRRDGAVYLVEGAQLRYANGTEKKGFEGSGF